MSIRTVGIMGCGEHLVKGHAPFLQGVRVVGVYDPSEASRLALAEVLGYAPPTVATPYMILAARPEGVLIGSPDEFHPDQLALTVGVGVDTGIPVLCEKPLAIDPGGLAKVRTALSSAQSKGLQVACCHQRRSTLIDLPYGWVRTSLPVLEERFGQLKRIGLNSNYPRPREGWKHDRSFLADKFVHDIDYLRALLDNGWFRASREYDYYDHYLVTGEMAYGRHLVSFSCEGTRLHNDRDAFIEYIMLNFEHGDCVVYTKTGTVRYHDRRTGARDEVQITEMIPASYDRLNEEVTRNFLNGTAVHTYDDLLVNTATVVALAGSEGWYVGD